MQRDGERGQVLVLGALMMTVMLGFLALITDVGYAYAQRRFVQNGSDAAAIAAARLLSTRLNTTTPDVLVVATVNQYLAANGQGTVVLNASLTATEGAWYVTPGNVRVAAVGSGITIPAAAVGSFPTISGVQIAGVEVVGRRQFDTFFASVIGYDTMTVHAAGTGRFGSAASIELQPPNGPHVLPIVFDKDTYDQAVALCGGFSGTEIRFSRDITNPFTCNGDNGEGGFNWSPLNVTSANANSVIKDLLEPTSGLANNRVAIGDPIQVAPGERAVDYRMLDDNYQGQDVVVPIIAGTVAAGCPNCSRPLVTFAWFHVLHANDGGSPKYIDGWWVDPRGKPPIGGQQVGTSTTLLGPLTFGLVR